MRPSSHVWWATSTRPRDSGVLGVGCSVTPLSAVAVLMVAVGRLMLLLLLLLNLPCLLLVER